MNFLAHARLSFNDPEILVGNMISDFVKGKKKFDFPSRIQQGIYLHRCIDEYTDTHAVVKEAKELFRPAYRLYSGAMIDVVFDHFLAVDEEEFTDASLFSFSQEVYSVLKENEKWFPAYFARMFPYMLSQNWLYNYRNRQGAHNSLAGLVRRAAFLTDSADAVAVFERHYDTLNHHYQQFWPEIKKYAQGVLESSGKS